jgi:threonyl-tRNA synthetase
MVHRALLGSIERFFGILVEHYAGAFPLWLAPEQVRVLPLTEHQLAFAEHIAARFREADLRVTVDVRSEKIGAKIRLAQVEKIPYMVVVGPREAEAEQGALRSRVQGDLGAKPIDEIMALLKEEEARKGRPEAKKE